MRKRHAAHKLWPIVVSLWLCIGTNAASSMEEGLVPTLDEVIAGVAAAERKLVNVCIESETFEERRLPGSDSWERTPVYARLTAWYNGLPKSKARVDVHSEVLRWEAGLAPYMEEAYSIGFDGQFGREARHAAGSPGQLEPVKTGRITSEAPMELRSQWCDLSSGAMFSVNFLFNQEGISTSEWLTKARDEGGEIRLSRERYQEVDCVRLSLSGGWLVLWFDLDHAYAFRGRAWYRPGTNGELVPQKTDVVKRLVEAAPGIWLPAETSRTTYLGGDEADVRLNCMCSRVVANAPDFNEAIFEVQIPADYIVRDEVSGTVYQRSVVDDVLRRELDQSVDTVLGAGSAMVSEADSADSNNSVLRNDSTATASGSVLEEAAVAEGNARGKRGFPWVFALLMAIVLGLVAAFAVKRFR